MSDMINNGENKDKNEYANQTSTPESQNLAGDQVQTQDSADKIESENPGAGETPVVPVIDLSDEEDTIPSSYSSPIEIINPVIIEELKQTPSKDENNSSEKDGDKSEDSENTQNSDSSETADKVQVNKQEPSENSQASSTQVDNGTTQTSEAKQTEQNDSSQPSDKQNNPEPTKSSGTENVSGSEENTENSVSNAPEEKKQTVVIIHENCTINDIRDIYDQIDNNCKLVFKASGEDLSNSSPKEIEVSPEMLRILGPKVRDVVVEKGTVIKPIGDVKGDMWGENLVLAETYLFKNNVGVPKTTDKGFLEGFRKPVAVVMEADGDVSLPDNWLRGAQVAAFMQTYSENGLVYGLEAGNNFLSGSTKQPDLVNGTLEDYLKVYGDEYLKRNGALSENTREFVKTHLDNCAIRTDALKETTINERKKYQRLLGDMLKSDQTESNKTIYDEIINSKKEEENKAFKKYLEAAIGKDLTKKLKEEYCKNNNIDLVDFVDDRINRIDDFLANQEGYKENEPDGSPNAKAKAVKEKIKEIWKEHGMDTIGKSLRVLLGEEGMRITTFPKKFPEIETFQSRFKEKIGEELTKLITDHFNKDGKGDVINASFVRDNIDSFRDILKGKKELQESQIDEKIEEIKNIWRDITKREETDVNTFEDSLRKKLSEKKISSRLTDKLIGKYKNGKNLEPNILVAVGFGADTNIDTNLDKVVKNIEGLEEKRPDGKSNPNVKKVKNVIKEVWEEYSKSKEKQKEEQEQARKQEKEKEKESIVKKTPEEELKELHEAADNLKNFFKKYGTAYLQLANTIIDMSNGAWALGKKEEALKILGEKKASEGWNGTFTFVPSQQYLGEKSISCREVEIVSSSDPENTAAKKMIWELARQDYNNFVANAKILKHDYDKMGDKETAEVKEARREDYKAFIEELASWEPENKESWELDKDSVSEFVKDKYDKINTYLQKFAQDEEFFNEIVKRDFNGLVFDKGEMANYRQCKQMINNLDNTVVLESGTVVGNFSYSNTNIKSFVTKDDKSRFRHAKNIAEARFVAEEKNFNKVFKVCGANIQSWGDYCKDYSELNTKSRGEKYNEYLRERIRAMENQRANAKNDNEFKSAIEYIENCKKVLDAFNTYLAATVAKEECLSEDKWKQGKSFGIKRAIQRFEERKLAHHNNKNKNVITGETEFYFKYDQGTDEEKAEYRELSDKVTKAKESYNKVNMNEGSASNLKGPVSVYNPENVSGHDCFKNNKETTTLTDRNGVIDPELSIDDAVVDSGNFSKSEILRGKILVGKERFKKFVKDYMGNHPFRIMRLEEAAVDLLFNLLKLSFGVTTLVLEKGAMPIINTVALDILNDKKDRVDKEIAVGREFLAKLENGTLTVRDISGPEYRDAANILVYRSSKSILNRIMNEENKDMSVKDLFKDREIEFNRLVNSSKKRIDALNRRWNINASENRLLSWRKILMAEEKARQQNKVNRRNYYGVIGQAAANNGKLQVKTGIAETLVGSRSF